MLQKNRLGRVQEKMWKLGFHQMLVTDPMAIYWLCGKMIVPGERFLGLLIRTQEKTPGQKDVPESTQNDAPMTAPAVLIVNELFRFEEELGMPKVYYSDTDDVTAVIKPLLDPSKRLGVDKTMAARFLISLMEAGAAAGYVNGSLSVDETRAVKDNAEQEKLRIASRVNDAAMEQFKGLIHAGVTELEVADQMLAIYKSLGASGHSFDPIVAFGDHAADPHHMPDHTPLQEGDTVLFDVGCIVNDYCSDMTRTFYFRKEPDEETRTIYNLVRKANESAEEMLRPGIEIASVDRCARDIITEGGYGPYFTHRLGHFIGLQDHEYGDVSLANHSLEQAGIVHSIEPGIYKPGTAGVRIEDLVLITPDGHEVLNHSPHDLIVLG